MKSPRISALEEKLAFQIRALGLPEPVREYRFAWSLGRLYRADFAWPNQRLLVEAEGGIFAKQQRNGQDYGWHQSVQRMLTDMEKYNAAALLGFRVLRYSAKEINSGKAVAEIERALNGGVKAPMQMVMGQ